MELWLAKQFRQYGVRSKTIWIGEISAKGYLLEDLIGVFKRYIPRSEIEALKAEQVRSQPPPEGSKKGGTGEAAAA